jgi:hypothetical protein
MLTQWGRVLEEPVISQAIREFLASSLLCSQLHWSLSRARWIHPATLSVTKSVDQLSLQCDWFACAFAKRHLENSCLEIVCTSSCVCGESVCVWEERKKFRCYDVIFLRINAQCIYGLHNFVACSWYFQKSVRDLIVTAGNSVEDHLW